MAAFDPLVFAEDAFAIGVPATGYAFAGDAFASSAFAVEPTEGDGSISIGGALDELSGAIGVAITQDMAVIGELPPFAGSVEVEYVSDTQRPLVRKNVMRFQEGLPTEGGLEARFQDAVAMSSNKRVRYQEALPQQQSAELRYVESLKAGRDVRVRFQDGLKAGTQHSFPYHDSLSVRRGGAIRYQEGLPARRGAFLRFQEGTKRSNWNKLRYQEALQAMAWIQANEGYGKLVETGRVTRYQEAIRPPPGRTPITPPQPEEPCYTPDPNLLFSALWTGSPDLLFVCEADGPGPEPGETIVVPVKKVYVVLNTATLYRVEGNVFLPTYSMNMSLDVDSWTWTFSASLPGGALADIEPDSDGTPVTVEATLNGVAYRFMIERIGRDRAFADTRLRISGRGLAAELDAPIAPILSFGNTEDRTAEQLMGDVLSFNGVPLPGWSVDWQIEDWMVAANAWKKTGSYIDALNEIVAAAGGYLQPTPSTKVLKALLRYPVLPWAWDTVTPDYELPADVFTREGVDWVEKPRYDRAYVLGGAVGGRRANVRREGTAGENVAPLVTEVLNTDPIAGRQRGGAILADTGRIATYSLRGPAGVRDVDNNPVGVIPPGKFVLYTDNGVERLGVTRSVQVEVKMPEIWQTVSVEVHEETA